MACNSNPGAPALIAPARAGAHVNFWWNPWYASHLGPLLSYMAPYEGSAESIDFNKLSFFKIDEKGLAGDNKTWAVTEMMENGNVSSTTIPHDIKPGTYVLRHELIALHYSTEDSLYHMKADKLLGPQVSRMETGSRLVLIIYISSIMSSASTFVSKGQETLSPMESYFQVPTNLSRTNQAFISISGGACLPILFPVLLYMSPPTLCLYWSHCQL